MATNSFTQSDNPYFQQAGQYYTKFTDLLNNQAQFNPDTDPAFQSYKQSYQQGAQQASNKAMADMNRRGILDSTITGDRLANIQQQANAQVNQMIPGLAANYNAQRQQELSNNFNMFSSLANMGVNEQNRVDRNNQFDRSFAITEAGLTGNYMPTQDQALFKEAFDNKAAYGGSSKEDQAKLAARNQEIYRDLAAKGYDPKLFNQDVKLEDAMKNVSSFSKPTMQSQQNAMGMLNWFTDAYGALPQGAGQIVSNQPAYSQFSNAFTQAEGKPTMASKQFDLTTEKFNFDVRQSGFDNKIKEANLALNQAKHAQDADYQSYLKQKGISEQQARTATNGYLSQVLNKETREDAMRYIVDNAQDIVNDGADIDSILKSIDAKFPRPTNATSQSNPAANGQQPLTIPGSLTNQ